MTITIRRYAGAALGAFALTALITLTPAAAQQRGPGAGPGMMQNGFGAGMMMGPGMMTGRGMAGRMCGPGAAGFAEWRIDRLERLVKPTEAQRAKLDDLKAASAKAAETMRTACPADIPATPTGMMEVMEKRMEAMLAAVKTVRPALEAFYNSLDDEQKAKMNAVQSRRGGHWWRWRDRWQDNRPS